MKTTHINWRRATKEELSKGTPEMIIDSEEEIETSEIEEEKIDVSKIDVNEFSKEQLIILAEKLNNLKT